jgi:hypothetical protein
MPLFKIVKPAAALAADFSKSRRCIGASRVYHIRPAVTQTSVCSFVLQAGRLKIERTLAPQKQTERLKTCPQS